MASEDLAIAGLEEQVIFSQIVSNWKIAGFQLAQRNWPLVSIAADNCRFDRGCIFLFVGQCAGIQGVWGRAALTWRAAHKRFGAD